jgi:hypothetical protein
MNASNVNTDARGLRGWWLSPPRPRLHHLISPWEYRHLRGFGATRMAAGAALTVGGALLLSYSSYGWAALFLALGVLNVLGGYWYINIARSGSG